MKITDIRHSSIFSCGYVPVFPKNSACSVSVFEQAEFWREENIKAFGGNLDNVTLFGQSSGSLPMKESQLHNGCINWCKHQIELGYTPSYVYYFNHRLQGDDSGAFHSSELWYMFGTLDRCWRPFTDKDRQLSEKMLDYWCNFIKTGDPNGDGLEEWKVWDFENMSVMLFE
ncbi:carboxylesterase family protein [Huintestinicola butyrica]|jgi:carboxylesterase type B|uniref:carboxylesterase family protein n=1 Tax=Huintestinicola butyrica TaxID=2981728 RepID=UPI003F801ED3